MATRDYTVDGAEITPRARTLGTKNNYLHAALAAHVAAWDSYINKLVREFVQCTASPLNIEYSSIHSVYSDFTSRALEKFNTPNSNNTRVLLMQCSGYDPINDWVWRKANMNGLQVRTFLDEILKVRHSFAHGLSIPSYAWTVTTSGRRQLNVGSVSKCRNFLSHLASVTDESLSKFGKTHHPTKVFW